MIFKAMIRSKGHFGNFVKMAGRLDLDAFSSSWSVLIRRPQQMKRERLVLLRKKKQRKRGAT